MKKKNDKYNDELNYREIINQIGRKSGTEIRRMKKKKKKERKEKKEKTKKMLSWITMK